MVKLLMRTAHCFNISSVEARLREKWNDKQIKLLKFIARGKKNNSGERRTMAQFADAIDVNPNTLYEWMAIPGWKQDMFEYSLSLDLDKMPLIKKAVVGKSLGVKEYKNVDIPAASLATKMFGVNAPERTESKVELEHSGNIGIQMTNMTDDELDKLIENARN